jgi:CRISPR-associated protein Cmr6
VREACRKQLDRVDLTQASNAGLVLSSYLKAHDDPAKKARSDALKSAISACEKVRGVYEPAFRRWNDVLNSSCISDTVEVADRAVIGLGIESPLETGLTLHHTYGTPIIPGSALKGLAAHYCAQVWGAGDEKSPWGKEGENHRVMFGDTEDAGNIIFHDSWIVPESLPGCLQMDVMTVHHPKYYQGDSTKAPSDYDDPVPISFLSVCGKFRLFVQCDVPSDEGRKWAEVAIRLLREAMEDWGFGGKTAAGYGRISPKRQEGVRQAFGSAATTPKVLPRQRERIQCVLIDEKTRSGGWKAAYGPEKTRVIGHIWNTGDVPSSCKAGDSVALIVYSVSRSAIVFRWPKDK